jgi:fructokinase
MNIISIGEFLWDVFAAEEHPGGAPFNFAVHSKRLGHEVSFISAVGQDERGSRALACMQEFGLSTEFIYQAQDQPTGFATVLLNKNGQPHYVLHLPVAVDLTQIDDQQISELSRCQPDWIYFGTLNQINRRTLSLTERILDQFRTARRFYDVNLRAGFYTTELVLTLMRKADVVKLNEEELVELSPVLDVPVTSLECACRELLARFELEVVCVSRGEQGCALLTPAEYVETGGYAVKVLDTVGAGDAFAAALLHGLSADWRAQEICEFANRLGALVASRPGAIPSWTLEECHALTREAVR